MSPRILFLKAHIKGYLRSDGTFVPEHDDKRADAKQKIVAPHLTGLSKKPLSQSSFFSGSSSGHDQSSNKPPSANVVYHPKLDSNGKPVLLKFPHKDGQPEAWLGADHIATVTPGGWMPKSLNGVPFAPWKDAPKTLDEWENVPGQMDGLEEPALVVGIGKHAAAGVVVEEPDGRVWVIHPSNAFGGYKTTFPKGTIEEDEDLSFQAVAIKEAFEESGLQVAITGYLKDVERSTSVCRYYRARRVGGTPSDCGWESQAVSLVPAAKLYSVLNQGVDHPLAEMVGAGPQPKPKPSAQPWKGSGSGGGKGVQLPPTPFGNKKPGSLF